MSDITITTTIDYNWSIEDGDLSVGLTINGYDHDEFLLLDAEEIIEGFHEDMASVEDEDYVETLNEYQRFAARLKAIATQIEESAKSYIQ